MTKLNDEIDNYILKHIEPEGDVLADLYRQTHLKASYPQMIAGHLQGKVLKMLCRMVGAKCVLEIGTFTGYSAICFAQSMDTGGKVHTIEINDELEDFAAKYIEKAGVRDKVIQHIGDALDIIPALDETFDIAFLDADKRQNNLYLDAVIPKLRKGGYIIVDNVIWDGKVLMDKPDEQTLGVIELNNRIQADENLENVILPIRDGLMIARKI